MPFQQHELQKCGDEIEEGIGHLSACRPDGAGNAFAYSICYQPVAPMGH